MKRNNGSENHADGPKETFRSRRQRQHPEAHINLRGKQQGLDTGSKQSGFAALMPGKTDVEQIRTFRKMGFFHKTYRRRHTGAEDSHLCRINSSGYNSYHHLPTYQSPLCAPAALST